MTELSDHLCECGCGQRTRLAKQTWEPHGHVLGQPYRFVRGHSHRTHLKSYKRSKKTGIEHRNVVERALGHALRLSAPVHHINSDKRDNRPCNLVACDSHGYHSLLHQRQRALDGCGNPNARKCSFCFKWDDVANMVSGSSTTGQYRHRECYNVWNRAYLRERKRRSRAA
jgi:hypothetical protein